MSSSATTRHLLHVQASSAHLATPVIATWCLRYPVDEMIPRVSADDPRHFSDIQIVSGLFKRPLHHTPAEGPQVAVVFARRAVAPLLRCASRKRQERSESRADGGRANGGAPSPRGRPRPHGRQPPGASGRLKLSYKVYIYVRMYSYVQYGVSPLCVCGGSKRVSKVRVLNNSNLFLARP